MIRVFIVHPSRLVCETIAAVLKDEPDMVVRGYALHTAEALHPAQDCDVILVSTALPHRGALELTQTLAGSNPKVKVLIMGVLESEQAIVKYIEAGAAGYIFKKESTEELLQNIRAVHNGRAIISPQVASLLMSRISELAGLWSEVGNKMYDGFDLTPREREVLDLLARGLSNQEIAAELVVEVGTIKNHVHNILKKLDVSSRRDVVTYVSIVKGVEDSPTYPESPAGAGRAPAP